MSSAELQGKLLLLDRRIGRLDRRGKVELALKLARRAALVRTRMSGPDFPETKLSARGRIFVSGFLFSGSGAVLDYLRGAEGIQKWPPGELRLLKAPGGVGRLIASYEPGTGLSKQALVDFYLHLVGRKRPHQGEDYFKWKRLNRRHKRLVKMETAAGYMHALFSLFLDLLHNEDWGSPEEIKQRFRSVFETALNRVAAAYGAQGVLIDQGINAWRLGLLTPLVPPSTFIVVHRDPRDQYVEQQMSRARLGLDRQDVHDYCAVYRKKRSLVEQQIERLKAAYQHSFIILSFEDFVTQSHDMCGNLNRALDLKVDLFRSRFDPTRSIGNIGRHKSELDSGSRAMIEALLPEYIHPAAS